MTSASAVRASSRNLRSPPMRFPPLKTIPSTICALSFWKAASPKGFLRWTRTSSSPKSSTPPAVPPPNTKPSRSSSRPCHSERSLRSAESLLTVANSPATSYRERFPERPPATPLPSFKRIPVLRLHRRRNLPPQRDRVRGRPLSESLQHRHLRRQHVAFMHRGNRPPRIVLHALGCIRDKHPRRINHHRRSRFAFRRRRLLRAQQARLHRVNLHHHVGQRANQFLLVRQLLAEFLHRAPRRLQEHLLRVPRHPRFFGQHPLGSLFQRRPRQNFIRQLHRRGNQRQLPAHRAFHQHLDDQHPVDFVGTLENPVDARIAIRAAHRIILMESVAAKNLHRFIHHEVQHLASVHLRNRAFDRVFLQHFHRVRHLVARRRGQRRLDISRAAVHHGLHRENPDGHLRQLFLH